MKKSKKSLEEIIREELEKHKDEFVEDMGNGWFKTGSGIYTDKEGLKMLDEEFRILTEKPSKKKHN